MELPMGVAVTPAVTDGVTDGRADTCDDGDGGGSAETVPVAVASPLADASPLGDPLPVAELEAVLETVGYTLPLAVPRTLGDTETDWE